MSRGNDSSNQDQCEQPVFKEARLWGNLTCLGTVHHDPDGFRRLKRWLQVLEPDLLLIELSPYGYRFRMRRRRELHSILAENLLQAARIAGVPLRQALRHPEIDAIRRQIGFPFEYRAARSFAVPRKIPVVLIDHSPFSMRCILRWPELISVSNLVQLLSAPASRPPAAGEYRRAREILAAGRRHVSEGLLHSVADGADPWDLRERYMADRLRLWLRAGRAVHPVFVGGWTHLGSLGERETLGSLLSLPRTRCHLLDEHPTQ